VGRVRGSGVGDSKADARETAFRAQVRQGGNDALGDVHQVRITCFSPDVEGENKCFGGVTDGLAVRTSRSLGLVPIDPLGLLSLPIPPSGSGIVLLSSGSRK